MKSRFGQYLQCENNDLEVSDVENSNEKLIKNDLEASLKIKRIFNRFGPLKLMRSCNGTGQIRVANACGQNCLTV